MKNDETTAPHAFFARIRNRTTRTSEHWYSSSSSSSGTSSIASAREPPPPPSPSPPPPHASANASSACRFLPYENTAAGASALVASANSPAVSSTYMQSAATTTSNVSPSALAASSPHLSAFTANVGVVGAAVDVPSSTSAAVDVPSSSSAAPHAAALARTLPRSSSRFSGKSVATTLDAPTASSTALTSPHPAPSSTTRFPRKSSGHGRREPSGGAAGVEPRLIKTHRYRPFLRLRRPVPSVRPVSDRDRDRDFVLVRQLEPLLVRLRLSLPRPPPDEQRRARAGEDALGLFRPRSRGRARPVLVLVLAAARDGARDIGRLFLLALVVVRPAPLVQQRDLVSISSVPRAVAAAAVVVRRQLDLVRIAASARPLRRQLRGGDRLPAPPRLLHHVRVARRRLRAVVRPRIRHDKLRDAVGLGETREVLPQSAVCRRARGFEWAWDGFDSIRRSVGRSVAR
eukprot:31147-Pelagococcus_subviridis.AAC.13